MRYVLFVSAALSVALHAAVLSARVSPVGSKGVVNGAVGSGASAAAIRVRTVSLRPPSPTPSPGRESLQVNEAIHAPDRIPVSASRQEPPANTSPTTPPLSGTAEADSDSYVPRSQLSTPPIAKTAIVLEPPPGEMANGRLVGILSLFIDEQGHVQHVAAEEPTLPPAFEQVAREVFMAAEFSPGKVDGRAVKSRQRVEVVFDYTL